jgi:hypothetical protein
MLGMFLTAIRVPGMSLGEPSQKKNNRETREQACGKFTAA